MLTEDQYVALARAKYNQIEALKELDSFYDHEKAFEALWIELGQQVLEQSISQPPRDRRKKKDHDPIWHDHHCQATSL